MQLLIDLRWLLEQQEAVLKDVTVRDTSGLAAAVARHRVSTPSLDEDDPDAYWRAAALLDTLVLLRPLPRESEFFAYAVAVAYLAASGTPVDAPYEAWRGLITEIRLLRVTVYDIADRLRSWSAGAA
ncbi:toxin Doc [Streptomyces sp. NPDC001941]|uniref:toxin Doc n=1 Tax=Streptomyces sp. NPDC001941 TaxID=3154659 RepID=UPI0033173C43